MTCIHCGDMLPGSLTSHDDCWVMDKVKTQEDLAQPEKDYLWTGHQADDSEAARALDKRDAPRVGG